MNKNKLDNPVWHALTETQHQFCIDYEGIKFYDPSYCPFGGFSAISQTRHGIDQYSQLATDFYVVGQKPEFSQPVQLQQELVCLQMLLQAPIQIPITEHIVKLGAQHQRALFELVNLVQPGYFKTKTPEMGNYYGLYQQEQLVAVAGERMKMEGYTELSAIVTHPEHSGKGYAKQLISHASQQVFNAQQLPFLHVAASNTAAIKLYEKLGFSTRREMSFWHLKRSV